MTRKPSKYNASLLGTSLDELQRKAAEARFLELLELDFGSPSKVRGAYVEWLAVRSLRAENPWEAASPQELLAISTWENAAEKAAGLVFGLMNIDEPEAVFELHVWNSRTN